MRTLVVCLLLGILLAFCSHFAWADEEVACSAMKIKDLREFLARKGKVCEGCAEKSDFVTMCEDAKHIADVPEAERPAPAKKAPRVAKAPEEDNKKSIDDILASLKGMPGMEGIKVFRPDDLKQFMDKNKEEM